MIAPLHPDSGPTKWFIQEHGYYSCDAAAVNVNTIKAMLQFSLDDPALLAFQVDLDEIAAIDPLGGKFRFRNGGDRSFVPTKLPTVDLSVPVILGFTPYAIVEQRYAAWTHDVVDGIHRLARAKIEGLRFLNGVKLPPHYTILATQPALKFQLPLYRDPKVKAPAGYWDLMERNVGRCFNTPYQHMARELGVIAMEYAKIGF